MPKCVCDQCANLKPVIDEESGRVEEYECEFGFPGDDCENCDKEECEYTCDNFSGREEEKEFIVKCQGCGKELIQHGKSQEEGPVFCIDCFLKRS